MSESMSITMSRRRMVKTAVLLFMLVSSFYFSVSRGQRSGWVQMGLPSTPFTTNQNMLGLSILYRETVHHNESWRTVREVQFFNGARGIEHIVPFTIFRGYYSFLGSLLSPFIGMFGSFILLNWLAWAVCAWTTGALSWRLFRDPLSSFLSTVLVSGSIGMITHIHDYSSHLLSFAAYYFGTYLLYSSGILLRRRPWKTHLVVGLYLSISSLIYCNGITLTAVYALICLRKNRSWPAAGAALAGFASRPLWGLVLGWLGTSIIDIDSNNFWNCLQLWRGLPKLPMATLVGLPVINFLKFMSMDAPTTVFLGFWSILMLPKEPRIRWFGAVVVGVPLLATLFFSVDGSTATGYLGYGLTCWVYCWFGHFLAKITRSSVLRSCHAAIPVVIGLLVIQFMWSSAHLFRWNGPVRSYISGYQDAWPLLMNPPTRASSMTGNERTPILYGGSGSLADAGAIQPPMVNNKAAQLFSFSEAIWRKLPLTLHLLVCGFIVMRNRKYWAMAAIGLLLLGLASSFCAARGRPGIPRRFIPWDTVCLQKESTMRYSVGLTSDFLNSARRQSGAGHAMILYIPCSKSDPGMDVHLSAGDTAIPGARLVAGGPLSGFRRGFLWKIDVPGKALEAMEKSAGFTLMLDNHTQDPILFSSWQRRDLPGRTLASSTSLTPPGFYPQPPTLPAVELRFYRDDLSLAYIGF